jgi:AraC-like DNA-binding protein
VNLTKHIAGIKRSFNTAPQINSVGWMSRKTNRINMIFNSYNFSLILNGHGNYRYQGKLYEVNAPCVLTQWPGEMMDYGPETTWEEFYMIYPESAGTALRERKLFKDGLFMWNISETRHIPEAVETARRLMIQPDHPGNADRIDHLCEWMVLETLIERTGLHTGKYERQIHETAMLITLHPEDYHDFDAIANAMGISTATFRRYWLMYIQLPPGEFLIDRRIRKARRLLTETTLSIGEVAAQSGFNDQLYFSRRFRLETGVTASAYRQANSTMFFHSLQTGSRRPPSLKI